MPWAQKHNHNCVDGINYIKYYSLVLYSSTLDKSVAIWRFVSCSAAYCHRSTDTCALLCYFNSLDWQISIKNPGRKWRLDSGKCIIRAQFTSPHIPFAGNGAAPVISKIILVEWFGLLGCMPHLQCLIRSPFMMSFWGSGI